MTLQNMHNVEMYIGLALGVEVEVLQANNTTQVNNYNIYDFRRRNCRGKKTMARHTLGRRRSKSI